MLTPWWTLGAVVLFDLISQCSTADDDPFMLVNPATGVCLIKKVNRCLNVRWTTGGRLFTVTTKRCLGAQGRTVGSEVNLYDCNDRSDLQKWECRNGTVLALKGQDLFIRMRPDETLSLSRTMGPNTRFTIQGSSSGACTRSARAYFTLEGNAFGKPCMFPFMYKDRWYGDCTTYDSSVKRLWCAVETKYQSEKWGYCPTSSTEHWPKNQVTGAYYQVNPQSALSWAEAMVSCRQQQATLVSFSDPNEQAFVSALIGLAKHKLWIGLIQDPDHGWQWSSGRPYSYLRWDAGHPLPNPGHNCAFLDTAGLQSWQTSSCVKKMGYICYREGALTTPPITIEDGFCSDPWIPYNGHCFHLHRTPQSWTEARLSCRKEGGDLVSIRNVEDHSFVISQLGFASTDELWIGLNDQIQEGLFKWSDHSVVTFTSWAYGSPTVGSDSEDCVLITGEKGNWADRGCDEKHGYICMKQSTVERTGTEVNLDIGCKTGWKRHGSFCYFVGTETKIFSEAKEDCKAADSYLADVSNGVDNAFLISLVGLRPEKYFWLGLSNQNNIDQFVWTNTDSVSFTHWNAQMPGYVQGCVAMTTGHLAGLWDLLPCTNQEKYICKHLAEGAVATVPPPTQSAPKCAEGWIPVGTRNFCSKFYTGPRANEKTWFEARDFCRAIGGDLLSIHGVAELRVGRHGRAWIGLHAPDPSVGYVWSDGSPLNFQHWQDGEPNNFNNAESCGEFRIYNWDETGSWNDANCESYNDWLCQIRAGVTPKAPPNATEPEYNTTSDGWIEWKGAQYYINRDSYPMEDARAHCKKHHGDLLSIRNKEENTFIWKQISRSYGQYYIGLSVDLDGSYWWMDGSQIDVKRWDQNQPNTDAFDESCVIMVFYMGFWRTTNCGREHKSICKRGQLPPTNTTVAPKVLKGGCPTNWKQFNYRCYSVNSVRRVTWDEARRQCNSIGGNLVSIPSRRVQAFLITIMAGSDSTDLWIGLNNLKQEGYFWVDGKPRRYTNWGFSKEQRRYGSFYQMWNEKDCVTLSGSSALGVGKWWTRSCNDTNGFVCTRDIDPSFASQTAPVVPSTYVTLGNDSIKAVTQNLTWENAKRNCEKDNANLASFRNEWTMAYVELLSLNLNAPLWIGMNKNKTEGYFKFIDGWPMTISSWGEDEPSSNRPCVYVDVDGMWKTALCDRTMNSVCLQTTDVAPTESTVFPGVCPEAVSVWYQQSHTWVPYKGHCYLFVTDESDWAHAASNCVMHGGSLASIADPEEGKFINSNVGLFADTSSSFWIGLYSTHQGQWKWLDKSPLDYSNWAEEEPTSDYGCVRSIGGLWATGSRWHERPYICKTEKVLRKDELNPEPRKGGDPRSRVHTSLIVVLVIVLTSSLIAAGVFFYKRSPPAMPTFDNPLYFDSERSQPDVVDTNKLIENAEEPESEPPIIAL